MERIEYSRIAIYIIFFITIYCNQNCNATSILFPITTTSATIITTNAEILHPLYTINPTTRRNVAIDRLLKLRGGKKKKEVKLEDLAPAEVEEEEEEIEGDEYNEDGDNDDGEGGGGGGGNNNQMMKSVTEMWQKTPPITQIYVGSSIALTLASWLLNNNNWPKILHLEWKPVLTGLQFWRPLTAFLFYGPFGINYVLTIHFVWTYMAQLEKLNYNKPEDFFMMMGFGSISLLIGYAILGLSPKFLGHNLSTFLVYIWARLFEGTDVNVMDLLVLRAELLPWFFCIQTLVLEGEIPFADLLGIVVGHLYHYISKKKLLQAPNIIKEWFESDSIKNIYNKFKDDFE